MELNFSAMWCCKSLFYPIYITALLRTFLSVGGRSRALEIKDGGHHSTFYDSLLLCPVSLATTLCILLMQAVILPPVSHRQLQPLRDYLCWAPVAAGRSQWRKVTH